VWDEEKTDVVVLLTNHIAFGATTISAIYKDRWQIEIFFKTLKQNLKIKTIVGTSKNGLLTQIWTALIAILILKYLKFKSQFAWCRFQTLLPCSVITSLPIEICGNGSINLLKYRQWCHRENRCRWGFK